MGLTSKILAPVLVPAMLLASTVSIFTSISNINEHTFQVGMTDEKKKEANEKSNWQKADEIAKSSLILFSAPSMITKGAYYINDVYCDGDNEICRSVGEFAEEFTINVDGKNKQREEEKIRRIADDEVKKVVDEALESFRKSVSFSQIKDTKGNKSDASSGVTNTNVQQKTLNGDGVKSSSQRDQVDKIKNTDDAKQEAVIIVPGTNTDESIGKSEAIAKQVTEDKGGSTAGNTVRSLGDSVLRMLPLHQEKTVCPEETAVAGIA